jgi:hypothetical protein
MKEKDMGDWLKDQLAWLAFSLGLLVYEPPPVERGSMNWIRQHMTLITILLILFIIIIGSIIIYLILVAGPPVTTTPTYP